MTTFVDACVQTLAGSAVAAERRTGGRRHARRLLRTLAGKRHILVTTHMHPDPDALGSAMALCTLLADQLGAAGGVQIVLATKGRIGGGINDAFLRNSSVMLTPWEDIKLETFDAIILLDTQPQFAFSPLPANMPPTAVIDHHRGRGRKAQVPLWDVRKDVGATCSIVFSYFMELDVPIPPDLAATMLYAIESDLAGAAGTPGDLDNIALSSLTLVANARKLYQMRYTPLPQSYFTVYAQALNHAAYLSNAVVTQLDSIESMEQPAVMADFLLRFDRAEWALVTARTEDKLILSLRTRSRDCSAADAMRRIIHRMGEGGGHRTKAGGYIPIAGKTDIEIQRLRARVWRRYLGAVGLKPGKPIKLVP